MRRIVFLVLYWMTLMGQEYPTFEQYVAQYEKSYNKEEFRMRKQIYEKRIEEIKQMNDKSEDWMAGVNKFTDWTKEQLEAHHGNKQSDKAEKKEGKKVSARVGAPTQMDWRDSNIITSIKDQGSCGACWAFAAAAVGESKLVKDGDNDIGIDLSQQYLLECTQDSDCSGGYMEYVMPLVTTNGVPLEDSYAYNPYVAYSGICDASGVHVAYENSDFYSLTDAELITLLQDGPIAISIASSGWEYYSSGVFSCTSGVQVDHAVVLVGYTSSYWIIKNQWGTSWGESGYIRVTRSSSGNCLVGVSAHTLYSTLYFISALVFMALLLII